MITNEGVTNLWVHGGVRDRYAKHPRARPWGLTRDSQRQICWLWEAVRKLAEPIEADKLFAEALEQLADCGVNCLQPRPPTELKAPDAWRDPWGNPLPNPFATKDLKGQTLLAQRDPELAKWMKAYATSPYQAASEWQDQQAAQLKQKALTYDADTHAINVYANNANQTEKGQFEKNADQTTVERCKWEATPITFPTGKDSNLTIQGQIAKNPRLNAIWHSMQEHERTHIASAKEAARRQRQEAEATLSKLESSDEVPVPPRMAQRSKVGIE